MSEEGLQIPEKRREVKSNGEKIHPSECRVPKNSKEKHETLPKVIKVKK